MNFPISCLRCSALVFSLLVTVGCGPTPIDSTEAKSNGLLPARAVESKDDGAAPEAERDKPKAISMLAGSTESNWIQRSELPIERWYARYYGGRCVGVSTLLIEPAESQLNVIMLTHTEVLEYAKEGEVQRRRIELKSIENLDGTFSSLTATDTIGESQSKTIAELRANSLAINKKPSLGEAKATSVGWVPGAWGPLGTLALLRLGNSQQRQVEGQIFMPDFENFAKVELKFLEPELTTLLGGVVRELRQVEVTMNSAAKPTRSWIDKTGNIVKSVMPGGFTVFETDRITAARIDAELQLATMLNRSVDVIVTPDRLQQTVLTYQIDGSQSDPFFKFSQLVNQRVKSTSSRSVEVTVFKVSSDTKESLQHDKPTDACNAVMHSESNSVENWAKELTKDSKTKGQSIRLLTEGVHERLLREKHSRKFESATEVAARKAGDCKGHAILLTALLRHCGIPARVASGLLVKETNGKMIASFHMWNEAHLDGRWIPIDAYQNEIGVGVDHIKMLHSTLDKDQNPYDTVLPVMELIPQLNIVAK